MTLQVSRVSQNVANVSSGSSGRAFQVADATSSTKSVLPTVQDKPTTDTRKTEQKVQETKPPVKNDSENGISETDRKNIAQATELIEIIRKAIEADLKEGEPIDPLREINLASVLNSRGRYSKDRKSHEEAKGILERLVGSNASDSAAKTKITERCAPLSKPEKEPTTEEEKTLEAVRQAKVDQAFYMAQVSLAETYLALGLNDNAKETLKDLKGLSAAIRANNKFKEVEKLDLITRAYLARTDAIKNKARVEKNGDTKKGLFKEVKEEVLSGVPGLLAEGIKEANKALETLEKETALKREEAKKITDEAEKKEVLEKIEEEYKGEKEKLESFKRKFEKRQKVVNISLAEVELEGKETAKVMKEIRELAGVEAGKKVGLTELIKALEPVVLNESDRMDMVRRTFFAMTDALKEDARKSPDKEKPDRYAEIIELLESLKTPTAPITITFEALVKPGSEDHIRYYVSLAESYIARNEYAKAVEAIQQVNTGEKVANIPINCFEKVNATDRFDYFLRANLVLAEAQLGAKNFKAAQDAMTASFSKEGPKFIGTEVLKEVTDEKKLVDYLYRINSVLADSLKGQAIPGEMAPLVLSKEKSDKLVNAKKILEEDLIVFLEKKEAETKDDALKVIIKKQIKGVRVSLAEVKLGLKEYDLALIEVKKTANKAADSKETPTSEDITKAISDVVNEPKEQNDLIKRLKDVKFWADFSKLGHEIDLLPASQEELQIIVGIANSGNTEAKEIRDYMKGTSPLKRIKEIKAKFQQLEGQNPDLTDKQKNRLATLRAWLGLKTFQIVKNDIIADKPDYKDSFKKLTAGTLEIKELGEIVAVPKNEITDDPQKPLDKLLYNILRALAVEDEKITVIAKKVPSDKNILDAVDFQLKANVIDEAEAIELKNGYQKNFAKIRSWINEIMLGGKLKQESEKVEKYFKEFGIE